eukprot:3132667-Lingulodinium_polyedra.AAC.1
MGRHPTLSKLRPRVLKQSIADPGHSQFYNMCFLESPSARIAWQDALSATCVVDLNTCEGAVDRQLQKKVWQYE